MSASVVTWPSPSQFRSKVSLLTRMPVTELESTRIQYDLI